MRVLQSSIPLMGRVPFSRRALHLSPSQKKGSLPRFSTVMQSATPTPDGGAPSEDAADPKISETPQVPRADDVLPDSLEDSLRQAAAATAVAIRAGRNRCIVEILLPEFWDPMSGAVFKEEGDQQRWWRLTKKFIEFLAEEVPGEAVKAIYPDIGAAAMLKALWPDASFAIASLNDRKPLTEDDGVIVIAAPDPQGADDVIKVSNTADFRPVVLFNPRLASGDVGVGLNVRRLRENFLKEFAVTYSLRPIGDVGSVFRKYPGLWQVFIQDPDMPGRYMLIAEEPMRPAGEGLDDLIQKAMNPQATNADGTEAPSTPQSIFGQIGRTMSSLQRFMRQLSN